MLKNGKTSIAKQKVYSSLAHVWKALDHNWPSWHLWWAKIL